MERSLANCPSEYLPRLRSTFSHVYYEPSLTRIRASSARSTAATRTRSCNFFSRPNWLSASSKDRQRDRGIRTEPFMQDELVLITPPSFESARLSRDQFVSSRLLMREHGSGSRH